MLRFARTGTQIAPTFEGLAILVARAQVFISQVGGRTMPASAYPPVVAVFGDRADAEAAINALRAAGFSDRDIGVVGKPVAEAPASATDSSNSAASGAGIGLMVGGSLGGLAVGAGTLPIVGPFLAGGLLLGIFGGALTGGLIGAIIGLGVPEAEAAEYERDFHSGRILLTIRAGTRGDTARAIVQEHHGEIREFSLSATS